MAPGTRDFDHQDGVPLTSSDNMDSASAYMPDHPFHHAQQLHQHQQQHPHPHPQQQQHPGAFANDTERHRQQYTPRNDSYVERGPQDQLQEQAPNIQQHFALTADTHTSPHPVAPVAEPQQPRYAFSQSEVSRLPQQPAMDRAPVAHDQHDSFADLTQPEHIASHEQQQQQQQQPQPAPPNAANNEPNAPSAGDPQFDIFEWYPKYQSCQRYFVDHAQHSSHVLAVAAFINIHLPFQRAPFPIPGSPPRHSPGTFAPPPIPPPHQSLHAVSLVPYLRRLVVTGLDFPGVLHGFFGDDWATGVGPLHEQERRNYLFAAKSGGWASVKKDYDMLPMETVPFMRPLQGPVIAEIEAAEKSWSEWLAMEDWMVGPRAPDSMEGTAAGQSTGNGHTGGTTAAAGGGGSAGVAGRGRREA